MTKIKCEYKENPYHGQIMGLSVKYKKPDEPGYCNHRGSDGICTLEEIEIGECDSGWMATCDNMIVGVEQ